MSGAASEPGLNVFTFKLGTGSERFTVLEYKIFRLFSTFHSLPLTRSSATNIEVSTTQVAKLTGDTTSWTKGLLIKRNQRKNSQLAYWRLLNNASLSSIPAASSFCYVVRLSVRTTHLSQSYEAIWWIVRKHFSSDLGLWDMPTLPPFGFQSVTYIAPGLC